MYSASLINNEKNMKKTSKSAATTYACRGEIETVFHLGIAYLNRSERHDTLVYLHERKVIAVSFLHACCDVK